MAAYLSVFSFALGIVIVCNTALDLDNLSSGSLCSVVSSEFRGAVRIGSGWF